MKKVSLGLLLLVGCAGAPVSFNAIAPPTSGDLFTCSMQQLAAMNYTVDDVDRESGWVRARKQTSGATRDFLTGEAKHGILVVTIIDAEGNGQMIRVTAGEITEDVFGIGRGAETVRAPSDETRRDARSLLIECAGSEGLLGVLAEQPPTDTGDYLVVRVWEDREGRDWTISIDPGPPATLTFLAIGESRTVPVASTTSVHERSDEELQRLLDSSR